MSLNLDIENDLKQALKDKNEAVVSTLRLIKSAIKNQAIELRKPELEDSEIAAVLRREAKKRQDSISQFKAGRRQDLADKEEREVEILEKYMPSQMSETDIAAIVDEVISSGINNFGQAMKTVMAKTGGQADGQTVQRLVKAKLGL
ncbi:MAG: GatB/YqeY domain-containing protein [Patescibacteria group bacterium]